MNNLDLQIARNYHKGTKHSAQSIRADTHSLDWENHPLPFKVYPGLDPIPFPADLPPLAIGTLSALSHAGTDLSGNPQLPSLEILGRLLLLSAGITKKRNYQGGELYFRAAACTGALYHIDLYLVCGDLPGLNAGVYHFGPQDFALYRLRSGDHRACLVHAAGEEPSVRRSPAILISASTYWRNTWKYRARTYRHCGWDNGTIIANLLATAAGYGIPAKVICGFVDDDVNHLLDLEEEQEAALSLIPLGGMENPLSEPLPEPPEFHPLNLETFPLSGRRVDYPAIGKIHAASSLTSAAEAANWCGKILELEPPLTTGKIFRLEPTQSLGDMDDHLGDVIIRRGSTREFARESISFEQLSTTLDRAVTSFPADFLDPSGTFLNDVYLIIHAVEEIPPGKYAYHPKGKTLELLEAGDFRNQAGHLGLGQSLPADAAVNIYFLLDLVPVLERFGNRGYRAAQLEAGILGGKLYLAAYAQKLGATGLTFFDDDVTKFFSPHAQGKDVMFLVAIGHKRKRQTQ